jgi:Fe-S-cluster containining protein
MSEGPFYAGGLRFSCARCSSCCRHESGFVYISENDLARLANELKMGYTEFVKTWCRWIPLNEDSERLSLKEKSNFDCIFWKNQGTASGCSVYHARPLQCRAYPFWDNIICSPDAWEAAGKGCPGINNGEQHCLKTIENFIRQMEDELVIERKIPHIRGSYAG